MQAAKKDEQKDIDSENSAYWNTLCGSQLAQTLGINDFSKESLTKFDDFYLSYYSYLLPHIAYDQLKGKKILEIGLGYGTLAEKLASITPDYTGLDIAQGPVDLVNQRLQMQALQGRAVKGTILAPPFEPGTFDAVIAIGSLHHTGDFEQAVRQVKTLLKPEGFMAFMVYNAYSYRRWLSFTKPTLLQWVSEHLPFVRPRATTQKERSAYDVDAPATAFVSARQLRIMLADMKQVRIQPENALPESIFKRIDREKLLKYIAPHYGLDLYVQATKA